MLPKSNLLIDIDFPSVPTTKPALDMYQRQTSLPTSTTTNSVGRPVLPQAIYPSTNDYSSLQTFYQGQTTPRREGISSCNYSANCFMYCNLSEDDSPKSNLIIGIDCPISPNDPMDLYQRQVEPTATNNFTWKIFLAKSHIRLIILHCNHFTRDGQLNKVSKGLAYAICLRTALCLLS